MFKYLAILGVSMVFISVLGLGTVALATQAQLIEPELKFTAPLGRSHHLTLYIGHSPALWCWVGEPRRIGLVMIATGTQQATMDMSIPISASLWGN